MMIHFRLFPCFRGKILGGLDDTPHKFGALGTHTMTLKHKLSGTSQIMLLRALEVERFGQNLEHNPHIYLTTP